MKLTVAELAERIGAELTGEGDGQISAVRGVEAAGENEITFVTTDKRKAKLEHSSAGAVIVGGWIEGLSMPQLLVRNVDAALIEVLKIFAPQLQAVIAGVDPSANVAKSAELGEGVYIGPNVVIDPRVRIGEKSVISSGCRIGENSRIGKDCRLDSNVVVYHNCRLGDNVVIQANSTIGSTGFGYSVVNGAPMLVPHNGIVILEDFVEIGANSCIDRAKFGETRIGAGTKIDNLVQIAHNVVIGKCCLIAGQVGIAGSAKLGDEVVMGGRSGVGDNIEIGAGSMVGAISVVLQNTEAGAQLFGIPAVPKREAYKGIFLTRRLPELSRLVKQLNKRVEKLEAAKDDKE